MRGGGGRERATQLVFLDRLIIIEFYENVQILVIMMGTRRRGRESTTGGVASEWCMIVSTAAFRTVASTACSVLCIRLAGER